MLIKVHVSTYAKEEEIRVIAEDRYKIAVKEPPENNRANERIMEIMRHIYPEMIVRIVSGHHSSAKIISLSEKV